MSRARVPKIFSSSYKPKKPKTESKGQFKQLFVVVLVILGGYFFTRLPIFQIESIDTGSIKSSLVISELNELVGVSILSSAVSNKVESIKESNIEIINIDCDKGIPNALRCRADERKPKFNWIAATKSYLVDETGLIYKEQQSTDLVNIEDRANIAVELGDQVISEDIISIYSDIVALLLEEDFELNSIFVVKSPFYPGVVLSGRAQGKPFPPSERIEVEFSTSYQISTQIELLLKVVESKAGLIKERIDLRTQGYVYYK